MVFISVRTVVERTGSEVGERRRWDQERILSQDSNLCCLCHMSERCQRWHQFQQTYETVYKKHETFFWPQTYFFFQIQKNFYSSKWIKSLESIDKKDLFTHLFNDCFFRFHCYTSQWQQLSILFCLYFDSTVGEKTWNEVGERDSNLGRLKHSRMFPTRPSTPAQISISCVLWVIICWRLKQADSF